MPWFSFVGFRFCFVQSSSKSISKMNHNLFKPPKFKRKPQPLLFYLRALKRFHLLFSPLVLQSPLEIKWGRNFSNFWSRGFGLLGPYEKLFVGPFPFCFTNFFLFPRGHPQLILSGLRKHFPSGCAFCLLIKLFSQNFQFFMNFENFGLFFILHVCPQHQLVLRNLVFLPKNP